MFNAWNTIDSPPPPLPTCFVGHFKRGGEWVGAWEASRNGEELILSFSVEAYD